MSEGYYDEITEEANRTRKLLAKLCAILEHNNVSMPLDVAVWWHEHKKIASVDGGPSGEL